jgi:hypothetical protein
MMNLIPLTMMGSKDEPFPMIQNIWEFFSQKGIKTVIVSIGSSSTPLVELEFSEMLGCPIHIFEPKTTFLNSWEQVKEILVNRKTTEETPSFVKHASKKWVLPRNVHLHSELPFFYNGTSLLAGEECKTRTFEECVESVCEAMKLSETEAHLDILKIDLKDNECPILQTCLHSRFRPSLLLVRWTALPDSDRQAMNTAANLQMQGYALVGKEGNNFLYYYNNNNYYETCSWEVINTAQENTLVNEIAKTLLPQTSPKNEVSS